MQTYIVAECSKSWRNGAHATKETRTISQLFEHLCDVNLESGYVLHSWRFSQYADHRNGESWLSETIVAVFQLAVVIVRDVAEPENRSP